MSEAWSLQGIGHPCLQPGLVDYRWMTPWNSGILPAHLRLSIKHGRPDPQFELLGRGDVLRGLGLICCHPCVRCSDARQESFQEGTERDRRSSNRYRYQIAAEGADASCKQLGCSGRLAAILWAVIAYIGIRAAWPPFAAAMQRRRAERQRAPLAAEDTH
ncbi:hypothetical protein I5W21_06200 [Stenotrophomonas maltophilia]|nr:hypothetical protein [Stenotrophomonas maltophilia]